MTLKAKFILLIFLLVVSKMGLAQSTGSGGGYFAFDWNMNAAQSDSDFNNGASGGSPGVLLGYNLAAYGFGFEGFYKKLTLQNQYTNSSGAFDVTIQNDLLGFGLRIDHNPNFSSKLGYGIHNISAKYVHSGGLLFASTIDGEHTGFYAGTGFKAQVYGNFELYGDLSFYLASSEFSLFAMEVGLRYYAF
jgi:hypothetical protein